MVGAIRRRYPAFTGSRFWAAEVLLQGAAEQAVPASINENADAIPVT
jgi:hypothetical protein